MSRTTRIATRAFGVLLLAIALVGVVFFYSRPTIEWATGGAVSGSGGIGAVSFGVNEAVVYAVVFLAAIVVVWRLWRRMISR